MQAWNYTEATASVAPALGLGGPSKVSHRSFPMKVPFAKWNWPSPSQRWNSRVRFHKVLRCVVRITIVLCKVTSHFAWDWYTATVRSILALREICSKPETDPEEQKDTFSTDTAWYMPVNHTINQQKSWLDSNMCLLDYCTRAPPTEIKIP